MYLLTDFSFLSPRAEPGTNQAQPEIWRLQTEIEALQESKDNQTPHRTEEEAFKAGLAEHEELLNRAREDSKHAEEVLANVLESERRIRGASATFLSIFGVVAALILGQGYLQVKGLNERAKDTFDEIDKIKPDLLTIRETRQSLDSELPAFLLTAREQLLAMERPGNMGQEDLALIDEIDHLTFLNAQVRFQKTRSEKEARDYLSSLLATARGHIARLNYRESFNRLEEFFTQVLAYPDASSPTDKARAHCYRAFASFQVLKGIAQESRWVQAARQADESRLREGAFSDIRSAKEADPSFEYASFVEALLYSRYYAPFSIGQSDQKVAIEFEGQRRAAAIYKKLLEGNAEPVQSIRQNYACCLKRIADATGAELDFASFSSAVLNFPDDWDLLHADIAIPNRNANRYLWQKLLSDPELFKTLNRIVLADYHGFWVQTLDLKVKYRDWREDLGAIKSRNPDFRNWKVQLI
jgi:hypothetical protein